MVREIPKLGLRTAPMGELVFEDCVLPAESLLGREGRGAHDLQRRPWNGSGGRSSPASLGTMRRQLDRCIEHARSRKQFGQPIGKFQSVSNRIVDMSPPAGNQPLHGLSLCVAAIAKGENAASASMAKLHVSESFVQNSLDAVRLFGAAGLRRGDRLERDLRDSVGGVIFSGTNDIQRNIIAQHLRLGVSPLSAGALSCAFDRPYSSISSLTPN